MKCLSQGVLTPPPPPARALALVLRVCSYFEYMSKAFFHKLPTVLCKIVGVYQIGYHNKITGKRQMDQVCIHTGKKTSKNVDQVLRNHDRATTMRGQASIDFPPFFPSSIHYFQVTGDQQRWVRNR